MQGNQGQQGFGEGGNGQSEARPDIHRAHCHTGQTDREHTTALTREHSIWQDVTTRDVTTKSMQDVVQDVTTREHTTALTRLMPVIALALTLCAPKPMAIPDTPPTASRGCTLMPITCTYISCTPCSITQCETQAVALHPKRELMAVFVMVVNIDLAV